MAKKILMIDDDMDFVEALSTYLAGNGYEVTSASEGAAGVEMAKKEKPALILLDVMMSTKTEGFETARAIKADADLKETPIIMISGVRGEMSLPFTIEAQSETFPVTSFLEKPVKPEILLKKVQELIG